MDFQREVEERIEELGRNKALKESALSFMQESVGPKYSYNFSWLGRPVIQYPQDIVAMQELIWKVQPELIIETGIAHGGSLILYASILELISACGGNEGRVVGIDIDIRAHNRKAIEAHPMFERISLMEGSSTDAAIIAAVKKEAAGKKKVMVCLDSNHTHEHVAGELQAYASLVTVGSYCVVFDTLIEDMRADAYPDRPWGKGNNPKTAVREFLSSNPDFVVDSAMDNKLLITVAAGGFLRRVK